VLQCVAVCCRVLQSVAECCRVLQGVAGCCRVMMWGCAGHAHCAFSVIECFDCSVLQCVAVCCSVLQCFATGESVTGLGIFRFSRTLR
jgi:hypothetical protein